MRPSATRRARAHAFARHSVTLSLCIASTLVAACNDARTDHPVRPVTAPTTTTSASIEPATVEFDAALSRSIGQQATSNVLSIHVQRTRTASGRWRSVLLFRKDEMLSMAPNSENRFSTAVIDEDGRLTIYRENGEIMPLPHVDDVIARNVKPGSPQPDSRAFEAKRRERVAARQFAFPTGWIDGAVMTLEGRGAEAQRIVGDARRTTVGVAGGEHFVTAKNGLETDAEIDPTSGALASVTLSRGGAVVARITRTYATTSNGISVRRQLTAQRLDANGAAEQTSTVLLTNIIIDGEKLQ